MDDPKTNPYYVGHIPPSDLDSGACFICLEGPRKQGRIPLLPCCSQCSALTHSKCWFKWRRKQRLATLRARLLATNINDPLLCTICKTGIAQIPKEDPNDLTWTISGSRTNGVQQRLQDRLLEIVGRMLQSSRGDEDESVSLPADVLQKIGVCIVLALCVAIVVDAATFFFCDVKYWGTIVLPSLAILYLACTIGCAAIAIYQRKLVLGPLGSRPPEIIPDLSNRFLSDNALHLPLDIVESATVRTSNTGSSAGSVSSSSANYLAQAADEVHLEFWSNPDMAVVFYV